MGGGGEDGGKGGGRVGGEEGPGEGADDPEGGLGDEDRFYVVDGEEPEGVKVVEGVRQDGFCLTGGGVCWFVLFLGRGEGSGALSGLRVWIARCSWLAPGQQELDDPLLSPW